jgi:hypothetical protein
MSLVHFLLACDLKQHRLNARRSRPASARRRRRWTAMYLLPAPVARLRRARFSSRAIFSRIARIAASW